MKEPCHGGGSVLLDAAQVEGLQIDLYEADGVRRLASSAGSDPGVSPSCTVLSTTLDVGTYMLRLSRPAQRDCDDRNSKRGDYSLRVSSP